MYNEENVKMKGAEIREIDREMNFLLSALEGTQNVVETVVGRLHPVLCDLPLLEQADDALMPQCSSNLGVDLRKLRNKLKSITKELEDALERLAV
jgi:hypothetical protein